MPVGRRARQQLGGGRALEEWAAEVEFGVGVAVGEATEGADADNAARQDVEEEAAQTVERIARESLLFPALTVILPSEADLSMVDVQQAMMGDGHTGGGAPQGRDDVSGSTEGALGIDDPWALAGGIAPRLEGNRIGQPGQMPAALEVARLQGLQQGLSKQPAEARTQDPDGENAVLAIFGEPTRDPLVAIGRQAPTGNDAMQMGVVQQLLAPGVEDGEEATRSAPVLGIGRDGTQGGGYGVKQEVVNDGRVLYRQGSDGVREGEDDMARDDGEELLRTGSDPAGLGQGLARGARAVTAGVVRGGLGTAVGMITLSEMAA